MIRKLGTITTFTFAIAAMSALGLADMAAAQDLHPSRRPSPLGMARTMLADGTYVFVVYGRPYERGRDNIFGTEDSEALVPYGKIWRTGANEATQITVSNDVVIGDETLPAGTYSVFTTPGPDTWTVHFNSALGLSGTARYNPETEKYEEGYKPENDLITVSAKPKELPEEEKVDQLTISFDESDEGQHMVLTWIRTQVRVPIRPAG